MSFMSSEDGYQECPAETELLDKGDFLNRTCLHLARIPVSLGFALQVWFWSQASDESQVPLSFSLSMEMTLATFTHEIQDIGSSLRFTKVSNLHVWSTHHLGLWWCLPLTFDVNEGNAKLHGWTELRAGNEQPCTQKSSSWEWRVSFSLLEAQAYTQTCLASTHHYDDQYVKNSVILMKLEHVIYKKRKTMHGRA